MLLITASARVFRYLLAARSLWADSSGAPRRIYRGPVPAPDGAAAGGGTDGLDVVGYGAGDGGIPAFSAALWLLVIKRADTERDARGADPMAPQRPAVLHHTPGQPQPPGLRQRGITVGHEGLPAFSVDVVIHTEPGGPSLFQDHPARVAVTNVRGQYT
jgi:hypothetical protein